MEKGLAFEGHVSHSFHDSGVPLLVSPLVLRQRSLGQLDLCVFKKDGLFVAECKYGDGLLSFGQRKRLVASCHLLINLFDCPVQLFLLYGFAKSFDSAYSFKSKKIGELR